MNRFVLDCSTTMAWCFSDETSPRADAVLAALEEEEAVVPNHWPLEVANVLAVAERRQRIAAARSDNFLEYLNSLPIAVDDQSPQKAFDAVLPLARRWRLSAYDAAYLELALRLRCPLASLDAGLNEAAVGAGVPLFLG